MFQSACSALVHACLCIWNFAPRWLCARLSLPTSNVALLPRRPSRTERSHCKNTPFCVSLFRGGHFVAPWIRLIHSTATARGLGTSQNQQGSGTFAIACSSLSATIPLCHRKSESYLNMSLCIQSHPGSASRAMGIDWKKWCVSFLSFSVGIILNHCGLLGTFES